MAAKKKVYWLGEQVGKKRVGRIRVGGKLIKIGMSFIADGLDKDRLSVLRKAGCIGDAPFHIPESADDDITLLQGKVSDLEAAATVDSDKIAGLELEIEELKKNGDVTELKKQIVELDSEVKRLEGEAKEAADKKAAHIQGHIDNPSPDAAALQTDNEEKAALIEKQKEEIKALKKAAKEAAK